MPEMVTGLAFTCDARALVAAGSDAALRMWDLASGRVRHTLTGHVAKVLPQCVGLQARDLGLSSPILEA